MEKPSSNPYELRLAEYAIRDGIRSGTLLPSTLLQILSNEQDEELRNAMILSYEKTASLEYKKRVEKVADALRVFHEFDKQNL